MEEQAFERVAERYGLESMLSLVSGDRSELLIGFTPWETETEGWTNSVRRRRPESVAASRLTRTVWDCPDDSAARVSIDIYECDSGEAAIRELVFVLAGNQLANVPEGPDDVGLVSFVQPDGLPPGVFLVQANVCLVVASLGTTTVDVIPWARRLDHRIQDRPEVAEDLPILGRETRQDGRALFEIAPAWDIGRDGFVKVFAEGGVLEISDGMIAAQGDGEVILEAFVEEPGRPTYRSQRSFAAR